MSEWTGGYGRGQRPANAKIPVKVHRNVSLIRTADGILAQELLAQPKMARLVIGRLTDDILLIRPGRAAEVIEELKRMGHPPQVIGSP